MNLATPRVIWGAILGSIVPQLVIAWTVLPRPETPKPADVVAGALAGLALALMGAALLVPRRLFRAACARLDLPVRELPDPDAEVLFRDDPPKVRAFARPAEAERALAKVMTPSLVTRLVLAESGALVGFTLAALGYAPGLWLLLFAVAFVGVASAFPIEARWRRSFEDATGARFLPAPRA